MRTFGTGDTPFIDATQKSKEMVYGAWIATDSFYSALLRYGTFDAYHFYTYSPRAAASLRKNLEKLKIDVRRVKIIPINRLPQFFSETDYTVFFSCGPRVVKQAHLRAKFAKEYFPVCGLTHAISHPFLLQTVFFENIIADLHAFDSIICPSKAVYMAAKNLNNLVASSLKSNLGVSLKYKARFDIIPLGIDCSYFAKTEQKLARKKLALPADKKIILYFGRISVYDKLDLYPLLVSLKSIIAKEKDVLLLIAGADAQGQYGRTIKKIAREMKLVPFVKFIFRNCRKEKELLYAASDIFVSPADNIQETFGLTVIEAMAAGLPVVAADWDGYKELVVHNHSGFLVPTYWMDCHVRNPSTEFFQTWEQDHLCLAQSVAVDIHKLTEFLVALLKNKTLRLKFGNAAKKRVQEKYDWSVVIPLYEKLWEKLSSLAQRHKLKETREEIFAPRYFACFRHYPSHLLNKKTRLRISRQGLFFLKKRQLGFSIPFELEEVVSSRMIFLILSFLAKDEFSVGRIEENIREIFKPAPKKQIRYNIMWMLKKGLLRLNKNV